MTAKIKLNSASGGGSVSLQAPTSTTGNANVEFKLPVADGTSGQTLTTNASGQLAFASVAVGGASNISFNSGNGIDFSATSGSGTSELFNDYEEGSWSPVWSNATSGGTTSSSNNLYGKYTKIGRIVHVYFYTWGLQTGPSGSMYLQGLPFTCAADPGFFFGTVQTAYYNFGDDSYYNLGVYIYTNQSTAHLVFCRKSSGDRIAADFSGLINNYTNFAGTLTYQVA